MYDKMEDLNIKCFSCNSMDHILNKCPLIHHIPKKTYIIRRYVSSIDQPRDSEIKRSSFKYHSIICLQKTQKCANYFIRTRNFFDEDGKTINDSEFSEMSAEISAQLPHSDEDLSDNQLPEVKRKKSVENDKSNNINTDSYTIKAFKDEENNYILDDLEVKSKTYLEHSIIKEESKTEIEESSEKLNKSSNNKFFNLRIDTKVFYII